MCPTFLISAGKLNEGDSLRLSTAAAVAVILVTPFAGALSDWLGRKPVLIFLGICSAILPITLFHLMAGGSPSYALFGAVILACLAGPVSAVGAITTAEQFPGEGRINGLALGAARSHFTKHAFEHRVGALSQGLAPRNHGASAATRAQWTRRRQDANIRP